MSRYCPYRDLRPILEAAQLWKEKCLLDGNSVFGDAPLWSVENVSELSRLVELYHSDEARWTGPANFAEALLSLCNAAGRKKVLGKLIAEMYWVMYLAPYRLIGADTKRDRIRNAWNLSGEELDESYPLLSQQILQGAGNPGQRFNRNFWHEFWYFVTVLTKFLPFEHDKKEALLGNGWDFSEWLENIPAPYERSTQFRHMLLFLLFPDEFERVFSGQDKKDIAIAFNPNLQDIDEISPNDLDKLLFETREQKEASKGRQVDWYEESIIREWRPGPNPDPRPNNKEARNVVFYGPPGTGKTYKLNLLKSKYTTKREDVSEIDRLEACLKPLPWWQIVALVLDQINKAATMSEIIRHEWIDIKSKLNPSNNNIPQTLWGELLKRLPQADKPSYPIIFSRKRNKDNHWAWKVKEGWDQDVPGATELREQLKQNTFAKEGIPRYEYVAFHQSYGYEDFIEGIRPVQSENEQEVNYCVQPGVFKQICSDAKKDPSRRYAIFIDEINRGNISKIFGELITLLEPDKRAHYSDDGVLEQGMELTLPYSKDRFGVPANLDVYATMNTADRSIVLMDTALRRRFEFKKLVPDVKVIQGEGGDGTIGDGEGGRIDLRKLLEAINKRIHFLYDCDHMIGHSYFTEVKSFRDLEQVFLLKVLPLLEEYFHEDWRKIQMVLRDIEDGVHPREPQIVRGKEFKALDVFGFDYRDYEDSYENKIDYSVAEEISPAAIRKIYE